MRRTKNKRNVFLPVILFVFVLVLTVGAMALANNLRQAKIISPGVYDSQDQIPRVTVIEANQAVSNGKAILLDTRDADQYNTLHIAGALNLPLNEIDARMSELDPETWYITYCT